LKVLWPLVAILSCVLTFSISASSQDSQNAQPSKDCTTEGDTKDGKTEKVCWDLIYPASSAAYVGGMLPEIDMRERGLKKIEGKLLLRPRQFRRDGQIALTRGHLLFAFSAEEQEKPAFDVNANYRIFKCTNNIKLSLREKGNNRACTLLSPEGEKSGKQVRSYVVAIPFGEVKMLSRAKYATSDLTSVSTAYATGAAAVLTAIASSIQNAGSKGRALGIGAGGLALYYYFAIAQPRMEDNYIAVLVAPPAPQIRLSRKSNHVTATPVSARYFVGEQIRVSDVANSDVRDNGISAISRKEDGTVTVNVKDADRFAVGTQVEIAKVPDSSFNGQFLVLSNSPTEFTYMEEGTRKAQSSGGTVKDIWNGVFPIDSVTATSFTYEEVGPDDSTVSTGTLEPAAPGNPYLKINGKLAPAGENPKTLDLSGTVALNQPPAKPDELFKRGDLLIFRIPNFHDYYNISMTLSGGTGLTFVSETAEKTGK
jgi:hypothetical protein